ncbi:Predicted pyrophosphatase or phosphodiesterase, AlkP superfamily [Pustulibacterium marinum]|uniref:Predicted pyrophosphatase or phosphodiesterase, AlkP superfamily n=1 Tax=Pustulibacterium marinum TaxID=1224947 RepID=A0A1I7F4U2_9FLAO|nr:alkaline phosphatase PafA [Pustulibacterium marinum]SFU31248.1 Predicted pyrophosphatase or phosphodiesterase, AlkP superfamily [Pustulibacterium marinum]
MYKRFLALVIASFSGSIMLAQNSNPYKQPKLVVGIVVDQMRYDYIPRYWNKYSDGGFKRLVTDGFNCKNNHFNYMPTKTGPGHASVYTGTTPKFHGIIANDWYDKELKMLVYCAQDDSIQPVGTDDPGCRMSPNRLHTSTVTDELKLATQKRGKVIGISLKDRGSILPAGHMADAAYWFQGGDEGAWVTSTYYMNELPSWVQKFNKSNAAKSYKKTWNTMLPIKQYVESGSDNNTFEGRFKGEEAPVFPHELKKIWKDNGGYSLLKATPYGNSLTAEFAMEAIKQEDLGKDDVTDFLAVSFSSTDYVGHKFGTNSIEVEDTYLRLDADLEKLLKYLDQQVGEGNYTVFLTADHGAVPTPSYLHDVHVPGGYANTSGLALEIQQYLKDKYHSENLIENVSNDQIFFNMDELKKLDIEVEDLEEDLAARILESPEVFETYTATEMKENNYTDKIASLIQKGFNAKESGNVIVITKPGYIGGNGSLGTGTTHGSPFIYDTHVPLLFYGFGVNKGSTVKRTEITDVAPTISALLGIAFPSGTIGNPIPEVLD